LNCKAKGTRNEHRSMILLEKSGYRCTRSAASLGCWDIVGVGENDFVLVQVKSNRPPPPIEMAELYDFRCPKNCKRLIHIWHDRQHLPEVREL
jgi:hypothetical protein